MNEVQIFAALRKFGNYVAGLFPALAALAGWMAGQLKASSDRIGLTSFLSRVKEHRFALAAISVFERFYWRNYSKDRLDLTQAPPEALAIMRPLFQLAVFLCLLIPISQAHLWPVSIETFSGFKGPAPAWSVFLWMICLPAAWAALLYGTAVSNRIAFAVTAFACTYFMSTCVIMLPRSYWNLLLSAAVFWAIAVHVRSRDQSTAGETVKGILTAIAAGIPVGIQLFCTTPLKPWVGTFIHHEHLGIAGGALLGSATALGISFTRGGTVAGGAALFSLFGLLAAFNFSASARSSIGEAGSLLLSSLSLSNSYLWPVWYFLGVGIAFKLLSSTKVITRAIEQSLPPRILSTVLLCALPLSLLILFSERIVYQLSQMTGSLAETLFFFFLPFYRLSAEAIWKQPLNAMNAHWFSWVVLADAVVVLFHVSRRKLTTDKLVQLFYFTCLSALVIWEYSFQLSSFSRTPSHSVFALFFFAVWLLWLMHTVGWSISLKSSAAFPAAGRLPIFGGILLLALLEIQARAAIADFRVMNELFLSMFRGVIDIGIPYYLYVCITRKRPDLPLNVSLLFSAFCLGALASLPFNVLDKLAAAGWNSTTFSNLIATQHRSLLETGPAQLNLALPDFWFLQRALIYVVLLSLVAIVSLRGSTNPPARRARMLFCLVAFAGGIASFSRTLVDLPLPTDLRALLAPMHQELTFSSTLLASHLSYMLPALLIALTWLPRNNRSIGLLTALLLNLLITFVYSQYEPLLRTSSTIYVLTAALAGLFAWLLVFALSRIERSAGSKPEAGTAGILPALKAPVSE